MSRRYSIGAGLVEMTGSIVETAGIPGVNLATGLLASLIKACEEVGDNEDRCREFSGRCRELLDVLNNRDLDSTRSAELRDVASQLELTLSAALGKMRQWPKNNFVKRLWLKGEIEDSLRKWTSEVNTAVEKFQLGSTQKIVSGVNDIQDGVVNLHIDNGRIEDKVDVLNDQMKALQTRISVLVENKEHVVELPNTNEGPRGHFLSTSFASRRVEPTPAYAEQGQQVMKLLRQGIQTSVKVLDGQVRHIGTMAEAGGPFSDVWKGEWLGGQQVAIKALRGIGSDDQDKERARKKFLEELALWSKLRHPHVLQCYGISADAAPNSNLSVISPWQEHGNVVSYVTKHPDAPRLRLMHGAAEGLHYLHSEHTVHGNVRCGNILVSSEIEAKIFDFGVSKIMEEITGANAVTTMTTGGLKNARWLPPELLQPRMDDVPATSFDTDVWSFSMAVIECMTGQRPYADVKKDPQFLYRICNLKERPQRPSGPHIDKWMTDDLWNLLVECWKWDPQERPTMDHVRRRLRDIEASIW